MYTIPVFDYLHPEKFTADTGVSNVRIGRVLSQMQDVQKQVIAYYSKTLNMAERNYCVAWWELLVTMMTLEHLHKCLDGQQFHLRINHSALTCLLCFKFLDG
jgi:hypothetical protein